jgi:hypothetical protein
MLFLIGIYIFYQYGGNYIKGMSEYAKFNNVPQYDKNSWKQENFILSIRNEFFELIDAITKFDLFEIILEFFDLLHSIIKMMIITILPKYIYCSIFIWIPIFFLVLPVGIKLSNRYKNYQCIRNHKNKNNCFHNCNYNGK